MSKQRAKSRKFLEKQLEVCSSKTTYITTTQARRKKKLLQRLYNTYYEVYKCPYCGYYHLKTVKDNIQMT